MKKIMSTFIPLAASLPPVLNILNKIYTPVYTPYGFVETTLPFWKKLIKRTKIIGS